jgi:hypothetical protein
VLKLAKIKKFPKVQVWILSSSALEVSQSIEYLRGYVVIAIHLWLIGGA